MRDLLELHIKRRDEVEKGIIPFVTPNSIEEEMSFNELFYLNKQINAIIKEEKKK